VLLGRDDEFAVTVELLGQRCCFQKRTPDDSRFTMPDDIVAWIVQVIKDRLHESV
jgi:hypothetical protein